MLDIMKEKEIIVAKILKNTEGKLEEIFKNEFKEFNVVTVKCFADYDQLNLEKEGKKVRIHLNSKRYKRKYDKEHNTGLYFKRTSLKECDFDEKEFKEIQLRIRALYEK